MKYYVFNDTDSYGNAEYDITGEEYLNLMRKCCECTKSFSLYHKDFNTRIYKELEPYKIKSEIINKNDYQGNNYIEEIAYYSVCSETFDIITTQVKAIFNWIRGWGYNNPEDPTFYRENGTVFLDSSIHNGVVRMFPINEDVSEIIKNELWRQETVPRLH